MALMGLTTGASPMAGQGCTTQAKMAPDVRTALSDVALTMATAVKAGDSAKVQTLTVSEFATPAAFGSTAALVRSTAEKVASDSLQVTQLYLLNAQGRKTGDTSDADFSCVLAGTTSETDFSIAGLPPGNYGFAMVEAAGERPWLLAFLMRQDGGVWKMAGFYPRARTAAGHDGGWYWNEAYADSKGKDSWLSWLYFGEADQLLRPANFATSTKLDSLRAEQRASAPPELADGISSTTPLVIKAGQGNDYSFTDIEAQGSENGKQLDLMMHLRAADGTAVEATKVRSRAAAKAFLDAHKDLRKSFDRVLIFADSPGQSPQVTEAAMQEIP
jgi:hypothetical protein